MELNLFVKIKYGTKNKKTPIKRISLGITSSSNIEIKNIKTSNMNNL